MQLFPKEDFLTGDQLMFEFNPEVSSSVVLGVNHFQGFYCKMQNVLFLDKDVNETGHSKVEKYRCVSHRSFNDFVSNIFLRAEILFSAGGCYFASKVTV